MSSMLNNICYMLVKPFYRNLEGAKPTDVIGSVFFMQKVIGFNRMVPWPAHFTSRILYRNRIQLGNRSFPGFSQCCYIQARNGIVIGHNLRMGPSVGLISANHNHDDYDEWDKADPIVIGDNVWIGMNVVVLPGVNIGNNVVIGANSVVNEDIPSDVIATGNPCRVIRPKAPYIGTDYSLA